jgi:hypothetical protein
MANLKLPDMIRLEVREYINHTFNTKEQQNDMSSFLDRISPSLKVRVCEYMFKQMFVKNEILQNFFKIEKEDKAD